MSIQRFQFIIGSFVLSGGGLALLTGFLLFPRLAWASGVVGDGTPGSCTEAALEAALTGGGSVTFNCGSNPVTITLSAEKVITQVTSLDGGSLVTLSGGGVTRLFNVSMTTLSLANVTLYGGHASLRGGAIRNSGALVISSTIFLSNQSEVDGGAIYNEGPLTIANSVFFGNAAQDNLGGAIYNTAQLTITASAFTSNTAFLFGSAIYNSGGSVNVDTTSFSENLVYDDDGTIWNGDGGVLTVTQSLFTGNNADRGGAIAQVDGTALVSATQFLSNTAQPGFGLAVLTLVVIQGGFSGEGGAILNHGDMTILDSVFTSNVAPQASGGAIASSGALTIVNSAFTANSTTADAGGAIYNLGPLVISNTNFLTNTAVFSAGAVMNAGPSAFIYGSQFIGNDVTDDDFGNGGAIVQASGWMTVETSSFKNHRINRHGGAIYNEGSQGLTIRNTVFENNGAWVGGAINNNSPLTVTESIFERNGSGIGSGGAIYNDSQLAVSATTFITNYAFQDGSAIYNSGGTVNIEASSFTGHRVDDDNGTIWNGDGGALTVTQSLFMANQAESGGAIAQIDGSTFISATTFLSNTERDALLNLPANSPGWVLEGGFASGGGALLNQNGAMTVVNSSFVGNGTLYAPGGAIASSAPLTVVNSTFMANTASTDDGGAIYNLGPLTLLNSTLTANSANSGGGLYNSDVATLTNVTLLSNTAAISGSNLFLNTGSLVALNTLMAGGVVSGTPGNCNTALTSLGHNLDDGDTCGLNATGDLTTTLPMLAALADNGGPTLTLALLLGSPAIDAGDDAVCPDTDQRGVVRPQDGDDDGTPACDIGAYEYEFVAGLWRIFLPLIQR